MAVIESNDNMMPLARFSRAEMSYRKPTYDPSNADLKRLVVSRFERSENACRSRFERFYRFEKLVNMITKKKQWDWQANAFLPYSFAISEQSAAVKWLALFMARPFTTVQSRVSGLEEIATRRQALIDWHYTGDIDISELSLNMIRQSERYGTSIARVTPDWRTSQVPYRETEIVPTAMGDAQRQVWKMSEHRQYRIDAKMLDLTDFRPEPGKKYINGPHGMRWCGEQFWLTFDELLALQADNIIGAIVGGEDVNAIKSTSQPDTSDYKLRRMFLAQSEDVTSTVDPFDQAVKVSFYTGQVPREMVHPEVAEMEAQDGRNPYERLVMLANDDVMLENIAMPWDHRLKPYVKMDCVPDPYDFWGKGKIEPVEPMNYVGNELVNMRLNNVKMAINALIGVDETRMPEGWRKRLISQPFGVVPTMGTPSEVIQRLPLGDVTQSSYTEQREMWGLAQEAAAINETMLGAPSSGQRTLGEHQLKLETSSKRLQYELVGQAKQLLGWPYGLPRFIIGLDRQYLPIGTYIRVVGAESPDDFTEVEIDPRMLSEEDEMFTYLATGAMEGINSASKRADMAQMLQALQPYGQILAQSGFDFVELFRYMMKTFGQDPNKYFKKGAGMMGPMPGMGVPGAPGLGGGAAPEGGPANVIPFPGGVQGGNIPPGLMEALRGMQAGLGNG